MPQEIAVLFGDAHLQTGWRMQDSFSALEQIVAYAIRKKVEWVIGAGDLIDKQRNRSAPITFFHQQLDRLADKKIKFGYIQGQHDYDEPPWLSGHRNAIHLNRTEFEMGDFRGYGLDYQPTGKLQEELEALGNTHGVDLLIAHQVWSRWMGDIALPQGDFEQIPLVTNVFTGDLHQFKLERCKGADGQKMTICSPGCTYQKAINEPSEHFFVTFDDDGVMRQHRLKSRPFIDWPVMVTTEDLDKFAAEIGTELEAAQQKSASAGLFEELGRPLLRVTYAAKLTDAVRRVEKIVNGAAILYWKELPPEEKAKAQVDVKIGKGDAVTPLSELANEVNAEEEPELFQLLQQLLETQTVDQAKQSLAKWRTEYLEQGT
jgi:predicted phosphodiesterase